MEKENRGGTAHGLANARCPASPCTGWQGSAAQLPPLARLERSVHWQGGRRCSGGPGGTANARCARARARARRAQHRAAPSRGRTARGRSQPGERARLEVRAACGRRGRGGRGRRGSCTLTLCSKPWHDSWPCRAPAPQPACRSPSPAARPTSPFVWSDSSTEECWCSQKKGLLQFSAVMAQQWRDILKQYQEP